MYMFSCDVEIAEKGVYRNSDGKELMLELFMEGYNGGDNPFDFISGDTLIDSLSVKDIVQSSRRKEFVGVMFVAFISGDEEADFYRLYFQEGRYDLVIPQMRSPWSQWLHYGVSIAPANAKSIGEF